MSHLKDKIGSWWLSGFRPMLLILLPIGQCMAQDTTLNVDLVGLQRRKVQVVMKNHSFSEYRKEHVMYVLGKSQFQKVHYQADTCNLIEYIVGNALANDFEKRLTVEASSAGVSFRSKTTGEFTNFLIDTRIRPKKPKSTKKNRSNSTVHSKSDPVLENDEARKAADMRYFKVQKRTEADNKSHVKVLGWD